MIEEAALSLVCDRRKCPSNNQTMGGVDVEYIFGTTAMVTLNKDGFYRLNYKNI